MKSMILDLKFAKIFENEFKVSEHAVRIQKNAVGI
jgi:hypothetical protein